LRQTRIQCKQIAAYRSAALILQDLLNDSLVRAINNNRFDPAYLAIVAATHLNDFVRPFPGTPRITQYSDMPERVAPAQAIVYYKEFMAANSR
jgi:hypothetical protein